VDVHRHGINLAVLGNEGDQGFGHYIQPAFFLIKEVQGFNLVAVHIGSNQFLSGMTLPAVGWIACLQAGCKNSFGVGSGAASHRSIDKFNVGVLGGENFLHGFQSGSFATTRPPGKDFHLAGGGFRFLSLYNIGWFGGAAGKHKGCNQQDADENEQLLLHGNYLL